MAIEIIVGTIGMDGFTVNKKLYCKELGTFKVNNVYVDSYFFTLSYDRYILEMEMA